MSTKHTPGTMDQTKAISSDDHRATLEVLADVLNHYVTKKFIVAPMPGSGSKHDPVMEKAMDHLRLYCHPATHP